LIWDTLLEGLGSILSFFYRVIPSYGVAIMLLTVLVRIVMLPLTIKQTRSMQAMQRIQPKVKELQRKHKGNRQKLNEELMKLYKEHQVNPLGGCLPLLLQIPVFIALYSVLRATVPAVAVPSSEFSASEVAGENTVCQPAEPPHVEGVGSTEIICDVGGETQRFSVTWEDEDTGRQIQPPPYMFRCTPQEANPDDGRPDDHFLCNSTLGTGRIPEDSGLFAAIVEDRAGFLGMELSCSPTQATSDVGIRQCAGPGTSAGGPALIGYYGLVALMVLSTWYSQKQMQRASSGPQAAQMQLMSRIMPLFLGFISISISAGVLVYWVTTNGWQIGQQYLMLRVRPPESVPTAKGDSGKQADAGKMGTARPKGQPSGDGSKTKGSGGRGAGSRKKRRKR
jgi:YidC/Oxa1 family membrane protein insertase